MSKQGKWASILIMEPPSVPAWARATKTRSAIHSKIEWISERDRFFIKTFCLPFWSEPSGTKRGVGGKPVIRGYWIVIGCNAGQGSFNAGQGSNRILPNCPFCHRHKPSCSVSSSVGDEQNTSHNLSFADQFRRWGVAKFPKVETMEMVIQILFIQTR